MMMAVRNELVIYEYFLPVNKVVGEEQSRVYKETKQECSFPDSHFPSLAYFDPETQETVLIDVVRETQIHQMISDRRYVKIRTKGSIQRSNYEQALEHVELA